MKTRKIAKDADTGRIVSTAYAMANPETTYWLTVKVTPRRPTPSLSEAR